MFLKKYLFIIVFFLFLSSHFSAEAKGVDVLQLKISPPQKMGSVFEGSPQSLNAALDDLAQDSSMLDSIYLFAAANTALSLNRIKDAAFF